MLIEYLNGGMMTIVIGLMLYSLIFLSRVVWTDRSNFSKLRHYAYNAYAVLALPIMVVPFLFIWLIGNFMTALFFFIIVFGFGRYISDVLLMKTPLVHLHFALAWTALIVSYVLGIAPAIVIFAQNGMT